MTYDLAALHANPTPHEHTPECEDDEGRKSSDQFLRCLRAELDRIRVDISK